MKKIFFLFIILILVFSSTESFSKKKAEKLVKIGCIDLNEILDQIPEKKEFQNQLQTKQKEFQKQKEEMEKELQQMTSDFSNASKKEKTKKTAELNIKIFNQKQKLADFIKNSNSQLTDLQDSLVQPVLKKIQNIISEVSIREGFSMIIDKSSYVFYVEKNLDITKDVIEELKKQYNEDKRDEKHK